MGNGKGLLLIIGIVFVGLLLVNIVYADNIGSIIYNSCTVGNTRNCLDVYCSIIGDDNDIIYANEHDGTRYVRSSVGLTSTIYNLSVGSVSDLQALSAVCEFPDFYTKYCTHRGDWHTKVTVIRRYRDSDNNNRQEPFHLGSVIAFKCEDWIPPNITILETTIDYLRGTRTLQVRVSDDERHLALNDDTNLSVVQYRLESDGDYERLDDCEGQRNCNFQILDRDAQIYIFIDAMDQNNNLVTHIVPGIELYPSLPLDKNNGFCPRPNECFISSNGDPDINTFEDFIEDTDAVPVCVSPGSVVNDYYCDANRGLIAKSERLYEIARMKAKDHYSGSIVTIYCSDRRRLYSPVLEDHVDGVNFCSYGHNDYDADCINSCKLYVASPTVREAYLFSSINRPSLTDMRGILPSMPSPGSCNSYPGPPLHSICQYNFRGQIVRIYTNLEEFLHSIGTSAESNDNVLRTVLDIGSGNSLNDETLIARLRGRMEDYFFEVIGGGNHPINASVFEGRNKAYQYMAYRHNDGMSALAMRVDLRTATQELSIPNNYILVGAAYHNYDGELIEEYAKSSANTNIYSITNNVRVYRDDDYTFVIGRVNSDASAAIIIEQLVVRLRPGGIAS